MILGISKMWAFVTILCFTAVGGVPVEDTFGTKIVGGTNATEGEFPWQVSIMITPVSGGAYHHCGGTLLDATHVVTAAHCIDGQSISQLQVVVGAHNIKVYEPSQQKKYLKRMVMHSKFNKQNFTHDVAMLTLARAVDYTQFVQPLPLGQMGHAATGYAVSTGWGNANPEGSTPIVTPDALQKVELHIIPRSICQMGYGDEGTVDETMVCAGNGPLKGACQADSGGPLVCSDNPDGTEDPYLCGIVSWGMVPCGQAQYPTVYCDPANAAIYEFIVTELARP